MNKKSKLSVKYLHLESGETSALTYSTEIKTWRNISRCGSGFSPLPKSYQSFPLRSHSRANRSNDARIHWKETQQCVGQMAGEGWSRFGVGSYVAALATTPGSRIIPGVLTAAQQIEPRPVSPGHICFCLTSPSTASLFIRSNGPNTAFACLLFSYTKLRAHMLRGLDKCTKKLQAPYSLSFRTLSTNNFSLKLLCILGTKSVRRLGLELFINCLELFEHLGQRSTRNCG